jgi:twitching motility protein PilT
LSRINTFLELLVKQGGSDLHLVSGQAPRVRINGILHQVLFRELTEGDLTRILEEFIDPRVKAELSERLSVGFAYDVPDLGRFRANLCRHHHGLNAVFRAIPSKTMSLDEMNLPLAVKTAVSQPKGLTLVTGPTGSGKTTTLFALVDYINSTRKGHIITIEDPIEFLHEFKQCVVTHREIGLHSPSFSEALKNAMREDPDVIMVGELRDLESVSLALTAAETGIQVLGTLHTNCATRTVDRIINIFPARRQEQIRSMLAESLRMIISQQLVRNAEGTGRVMAAEILFNTHAAGSIIRSGNSHKLNSVIQSGGKLGMQSLDGVLKDLLRKEIITGEDAYEHAVDRAQFERYVVGHDKAA